MNVAYREKVIIWLIVMAGIAVKIIEL